MKQSQSIIYLKAIMIITMLESRNEQIRYLLNTQDLTAFS